VIGRCRVVARLAAVFVAVVAVLAAGCQREIKLLPRAPGGNDGPAGEGGGGSGDGGAAAACTGSGEPIRLPTSAGPTCASALEARGHRFVLCACEAMTVPGRIRTDAFDSRNAAISDETSAAIGVNGGLQSTTEVRAGGALIVAGADGIRALDHVEAATTLRVGGPLTRSSSNADVGADAYVAGNVSGSVRIDGALHLPAGAAVGAEVQAASIVREDVAVEPPCDCSAGFADVAAALQSAIAANDNAAAGLRSDLLASVTAPVRIDLPCGTFHLDGIDAQSSVTFAVHGRALLAIPGDVTLRGGFSVELDPAAELDLLLAARLTTSGGDPFGAAAAPARFRVWIAGTSSVVFDDQPEVSAVVRAPAAIVTASAGLSLYGSLLAKAFAPGADTLLHFDRAILEAGAGCGEPAASPVR
jgi:hypothetical protein